MKFNLYLVKRSDGVLMTAAFGSTDASTNKWNSNHAWTTKFYRTISGANKAISQLKSRSWLKDKEYTYEVAPVTVTVTEGHEDAV